MPADRDPRPTTVRSIREPGASPREPRLTPPARPQRPPVPAQARAPRSRPDANPVRLMIGFAGLASAAAFTTAMLPSVTPAPTTDVALEPVVATAVEQVPAPDPSVLHETRYVQLKAGQTAPPQSTVVVRPTPTPRVKVKVKVVTQTKQSGKP